MSQQSAIEWTDATWNPVRGCTKVSPGCANCYAETFAERFRGVKGHPYEQGFDLRLVPEKLLEPLSWKKPRRVFVNSMSDLFQDGVPDAFIDQVFAVMVLAKRHTFQVLTKRAERMREYMAASYVPGGVLVAMGDRMFTSDADLQTWPPKNVWLGVSVENQRFADERIPLLLDTPAAVRFISAEPLLGPLDLSDALFDYSPTRAAGYEYMPHRKGAGVSWVIVGGESGHGARGLNVEWVQSLVVQCQSAGVAVFVKQLGAKPFYPYSDGTPLADCHLKSRKGGDMAEWPADLRVREFPS